MRTIAISLVVSMLGAAVPVFAQASRESGKEVRIAGCVQWEKDYKKAGAGNHLVLTMVKPESDRKAVAYSITGDREKELARRVGQEVEVIGVIEDEGKPGSERFGDLPRIKMTAWVPLKDSCQAQ
jgi:hypothetical protein